MAMAAVSLSPGGVGTSVGEYVAEALRVLARNERVTHEPGPMFTTIEGELSDIFAAVVEMQAAVFAMGASRVGLVIKTDERSDKPVTIEGKMQRLEELLRD